MSKGFSALSFRDLMKRLAGQTSIYGSGFLLTNATAFLLLPVYLRYLTPAEYGILSVARIAPNFLMSLVTLNLHGAVIRFYYEWRKRDCELEAIFTVWIFSLIWGCFITILCIFFGQMIFGVLFKQVPFDPYIKLAILAEAVTLTALISNKLMRIKEQVKAYTIINYATTLLIMGLIIFFVAYKKEGVKGALTGLLTANLLMMVPHSIIMIRNSRFRMSILSIKESLRYSIPLVPGNSVNNIFGVLDRFLLDKFVPASQIGVYSVGRLIANIISMITGMFQLGMRPFFIRAALERTDYRMIISRSFLYFIYVLAFLSFCIMMFAPEIILLMGKAPYIGASVFVGPLILAFAFDGIILLPRAQIALSKRTKYMSFINITKFIVYGCIGYTLIPFTGINGVIFTYIITNAIALVLFYVIGHRLYPINLPMRKIATILLAALVIGLIVNSSVLMDVTVLDYKIIFFKACISIVLLLLILFIEFPAKLSKLKTRVVSKMGI